MFDRFFGRGDASASSEASEVVARPAPVPTDPKGDTETVRRIVGKLESMPPDQARLMASAAYILARAANADLEISDDETAAMEEALQRTGAIDEATAILVVEMAKLQAKSVGATEDYVVTREFRAISTPEQRLDVVRACFVIGAANGSISAEESAVANEIANELDIEDRDPGGHAGGVHGADVGRPATAQGHGPDLNRAPLRTAARAIAVGLVALIAVAGCSPTDPDVGDSIATFRVADGSTFKVLITDPATIATVQSLADGKDVPSIPNGAILHETGVNSGWSWSLDPTDFTFSDIVDASCQTTPQEIEDGTFQGDRFCPWSAIVVSLEAAP